MNSTKEANLGKFISTAANEASMGMKLYGEQLARTGLGRAISGGIRGGRQAAASHVSPRMMGPIDNLVNKYRKGMGVVTGTGIGALGPQRFNTLAQKANRFAMETAETAGQPSVGGAVMQGLKKLSYDTPVGYQSIYMTKDAGLAQQAMGYFSSLGQSAKRLGQQAAMDARIGGQMLAQDMSRVAGRATSAAQSGRTAATGAATRAAQKGRAVAQKGREAAVSAAKAEQQAAGQLVQDARGLYTAARQAGSNPISAAFQAGNMSILSNPAWSQRYINFINPNKLTPPGVPTPGGAISKGLGAVGEVFKTAEISGVERLPSGQIKYRGEVFPGFNKPKNAPKGSKHKKRVLAKKGDKVKVVNFGARGYKHNYSAAAKKNYLARSAGIKGKDDKFSANYWSRRVLWPRGQKADGSSKKSSYGFEPHYGHEKVALKQLLTSASQRAGQTGASLAKQWRAAMGPSKLLHEGTLRHTLIDAALGGTTGALGASDGNRLYAAGLGAGLGALSGRFINNQARKAFVSGAKALKPAPLAEDAGFFARIVKGKLNPVRQGREALYKAIERPDQFHGYIDVPGKGIRQLSGIDSGGQTAGLVAQTAAGLGLGGVGLALGMPLGIQGNMGRGAGMLFKEGSYLGLPKKKIVS